MGKIDKNNEFYILILIEYVGKNKLKKYHQ